VLVCVSFTPFFGHLLLHCLKKPRALRVPVGSPNRVPIIFRTVFARVRVLPQVSK
jgi:hypothetical protein